MSFNDLDILRFLDYYRCGVRDVDREEDRFGEFKEEEKKRRKKRFVLQGKLEHQLYSICVKQCSVQLIIPTTT